MQIDLSKPFAASTAVDEYDVRQMKGALNRLGYYRPNEKTGMTGLPDARVFAALTSFQKDQGLRPTGVARPADGTVRALNAEAAKPKEGYYVWRTCEDDRVRAGHAAYNHAVRSWSDSPDPCEEFNCRCWADPATPEQAEKKKKERCFDDLPWEAEAKANLKAHEEDMAYPYIDSAFKITVGIGINIDGKTKFTGLPWNIGSENGHAATKAQITAGYEALQREKSNPLYIKVNERNEKIFNLAAIYQDDWTPLWLPKKTRDELFAEKFDYFRKVLTTKRFAQFDCFPPGAKMALMDMMFNMGETVFAPAGWKHFFKAVNQRDWRKAADECHRKGVSEKRNDRTRELFIEAAEMEEESQR